MNQDECILMAVQHSLFICCWTHTLCLPSTCITLSLMEQLILSLRTTTFRAVSGRIAVLRT